MDFEQIKDSLFCATQDLSTLCEQSWDVGLILHCVLYEGKYGTYHWDRMVEYDANFEWLRIGAVWGDALPAAEASWDC